MSTQIPHVVNNNIRPPLHAPHSALTATAYEKRSKPADRTPTARLEDILPANSPYFELSQWEKQIDSHIMAKQMRVADAAFKGPKVKRMLRVMVYNLANDQPEVKGNNGKTVQSGPYAVFSTDNNDGDLLAAAASVNTSTTSSSSIPSWTLCIEGKLEAKAGRPSTASTKKFSHFIRSIIVQIGDNQGEDVVEWRRTSASQEFDGFEIKRRGDKNVPVKILIEVENKPERFKLSSELSSLLNGLAVSTKPHIVMAMWRYVKLNKLQESDEKKVINCDKALKDLFSVDKCTFSDLPALLTPHLSPVDPIEIDYTVIVDNGETVNYGPNIYELEVDLDDWSRLNRNVIGSNPNLYNLQLDMDSASVRLRELAESLRANVHNLKLLQDFSHDPISFIRSHYQAQCEDINAILGDARVNVGDLFKADRFRQEDVELAVKDMMCGVSEMRLRPHHWLYNKAV